MKEIFNKTTNSIIISSLLACLVGVVMIINPEMSIRTIALIAAIYIIIHGITLIALDIKASMFYIPFNGFISGVLSVILGIVLLAMPNLLTTIFTIAIGFWILLQSIDVIKMALVIKNKKTPWIMLLLLGILDLLVGILVIFNPFEASISITVFAGIMILIHSLINISDMILIKKDVKNISKSIENAVKSR